ncbi:heavy metal-associated isoprenylated plant protein 41 [Capsella rubella]|uniref:heavy metal-associated isoprenylated plant protein 41 n=1 Tax=Capsella rubella TaxID=81985 RepID=UPI000CD56380|nr:heavy metal-associated isoprenylated plant protein 41 [Capsella rubella]
MMKQRIVLKMDVSDSEKSMKKAMKIASAKSGVRSVSILGQNDQLVLLGEGIDLAELIRELKRKVCQTSIITVQAAPPPQQQPHPMAMGQYNQMPPARRCTCEIPNSGFCGICCSMSQHTYQMVSSPYPPQVLYCRDETNSCNIL